MHYLSAWIGRDCTQLSRACAIEKIHNGRQSLERKLADPVFFFQIRRATSEELNHRILFAKNRRLLSTTRDSCVIRFESIQQYYRHDFLVIRHCARHCARERVRCLPKIDNVKISRFFSLCAYKCTCVFIWTKWNSRSAADKNYVGSRQVDGTSTTSEKRL